jgi:hypothetical protein
MEPNEPVIWVPPRQWGAHQSIVGVGTERMFESFARAAGRAGVGGPDTLWSPVKTTISEDFTEHLPCSMP